MSCSQGSPGRRHEAETPGSRLQGPVGRVPPASVGLVSPGQQCGWGRPPLSGLTHLLRQPPYHPALLLPPCKVTLGGERPAPPPLLPCLCPRALGAFSVSPSPLWGWGQEGGPRRGRWRSRAWAAIIPCCEAPHKPGSSSGIPALGTPAPFMGVMSYA